MSWPGGALSSALASGRDERYGSKTTIASRAACRNRTIITTNATMRLPPPAAVAPIRKAMPGDDQRRAKIGERCQRQIAHVAERECVRFRMLRQSSRNVARSRQVPDLNQDDGDRNAAAPAMPRSRYVRGANPDLLRAIAQPMQQRQRGIAGHRIIFLRRRET